MKVSIPSPLRSYTDERAEVEAGGADLAGLFEDLDRRFPGIRFRVIDETGRLRRHIKVFVNGVPEEDLTRALTAADQVFVVAALSGG